MPRGIPLTLEEKRERGNAKYAESHKAASVVPETPAPKPAADGAVRRKRGVFNGTQGRLTVEGNIPGYHLHILNDDGNRIQDAQANGYEFVAPGEIEGVSENVTSRNGDIGDSRVRFLVGTKERGDPMYGYLMKIRQEWFDEDQADLQAKNDRIDAAIRKGQITGENPAFYTPKDGIKLSA